MSHTALPTLYKRNKDGSFQQWTISTDGAVMRTEYGKVGGAMQYSEKAAVGKNAGRANATTDEEQAEFEARSEWSKKKDRKGYFLSVKEAEDGGSVPSPMLVHKYGVLIHDKTSKHWELTKDAAKIEYPAYVQPKLDGIRCLANADHMYSREHSEFCSLPHIKRAVQELAQNSLLDGRYLDGELYNHAYKDDFGTIVSAVKSKSPTPEASQVEYHIYDIHMQAPYEERLEVLRGLFSEGSALVSCTLNLVPTFLVSDEAELFSYFSHFVNAGYEGAIVRNARGMYEEARSYQVQKLKYFYDDEFKIVGVKSGRGKMADKAIFTVQVSPGITCDVKLRGELAYLKQLYDGKDDLIGKMLTVRFQGKGSDGSLRFPVGIAVRDYE